MNMFTSNQMPIVVITAVFLLITLILLIVIAYQAQAMRKQLAENRQPRTGFLGKPMATISIMFLMLGGFGITYLANTSTTQISDVSASDAVSYDIVTFHNRIDNSTTQVKFNLEPRVGGVLWDGDNPNAEFDVFWTIKGQDSFSQIELGLNSEKVGGFTRTLKNGYYSITAEVFYAGNNWTVTGELQL